MSLDSIYTQTLLLETDYQPRSAKSKGMELINNEKIKGDRRITLRMTSEGKYLAHTIKSITYE